MDPSSKDIYHQDVPPPLARRRRWFEGRRPAAPSGTPASEAYRNTLAGQSSRPESGLHPDHRVRRRRRRSEHAPQTSRANRMLWFGVAAVAALYLALLGAFKAWTRLHPPPPAPAPAPAPVVVESTGPAELPPLAEQLQGWKRAIRFAAEGERALEAGRLDDAEARLTQALKEDPDFHQAQLGLARVLVQQKKTVEAETLLRRVLSADPERMPARLALVSIYAAEGRHADTLAMAQWILEADSYSIEAHEYAAQAFLGLEQPVEAITHLRRLVGLNSDDLIARNNLGVAYMKVKDHRAALATFRDVLKEDPGNSVAYYNMAVCHARQNQAAEAVDLLGRAARKFGSSFVLTWTQSSDFDPIAGDPAFRRFVEEGARPPEQPADATVPADAPAPSDGV